MIVFISGGGGHQVQSSFVSWQISLLAGILGGITAGANSRNGAINGFWAGLLAAALVVIGPASGLVPMTEIGSWMIGSSATATTPAAIVVQGIQTLILGFLGGWLGAMILPPGPQLRSFGPAAQ
jgi:hypothetical protein